jgi:hypothetical protein
MHVLSCMKAFRLLLVAAALGASLTGCIVHTYTPCHTECYWEHGYRVCQRVC